MPEILNIGENIRAFRRSLGITQEKLAEESGLSVNFISRLERTSDQNVSIKTLNKIANAMQISRAGMATGLVSIPNRYMHSPVEVVSLDDMDKAADLLARFAERIDAKTNFVP